MRDSAVGTQHSAAPTRQAASSSFGKAGAYIVAPRALVAVGWAAVAADGTRGGGDVKSFYTW